MVAQLRADGVTVLDRLDWAAGMRPLTELGLTTARHRSCPGHAAFVSQGSHYVDGHTEWTWAADYVCTAPRTHHPTDSTAAAEGTLDDEAARAQRAEVIARNKEWRSAEQVRRAWLAEFAQRQRPPAGAERFVAAALLRGDDCIRRALENRYVLLRELTGLGVEDQASRGDRLQLLAERVQHVPPKRALVLAAAALLAAWEHTADVGCWRPPLGGHRGVDRFYLGQYVAWGYPPSDIEQLILNPTDGGADHG